MDGVGQCGNVVRLCGGVRSFLCVAETRARRCAPTLAVYQATAAAARYIIALLASPWRTKSQDSRLTSQTPRLRTPAHILPLCSGIGRAYESHEMPHCTATIFLSLRAIALHPLPCARHVDAPSTLTTQSTSSVCRQPARRRKKACRPRAAPALLLERALWELGLAHSLLLEGRARATLGPGRCSTAW